MERATAGRASAGQANGDGAGDVGAPVERGGLIDDLIEADRREIGKLHLDDGAKALDRRANGASDDRVFAQGRIQDPPRKLLRQVLRGLEGAAELPDVLAIN